MKAIKLVLGILMCLVILAGIYYIFTYKVLSFHKLNKKILTHSLEKGTEFLLNNQRETGNFNYEYNFVSNRQSHDDNQVRKAGALWGLSLLHAFDQDTQTENAILKGIGFFMSNSIYQPAGQLSVVYKQDKMCSAGTTALFALSITELMNTNEKYTHDTLLMKALKGSISTLLSMRMDDGRFAAYYAADGLTPVSSPNPYADGEALLALVKSFDLVGNDSIRDIILESAENMYRVYVVEAQKKEKDNDLSKGFYQWGTMAFFQIYSKGWDNKYADRIVQMAYWMIDIHKVRLRTKNTAYAMEGLVHAWQVARLTHNREAQKKIGKVVDRVLFKLITWQVNGPRENWYLHLHPTKNKYATGGIMNYCCDQNLRIDVVQHQMHATLLALEYLY